MSARSKNAVSRGLSLVELMVGITIGLFIVAAATVMVSGQLNENRRLILESQLQQDLRATTDIITRELRRVGTDSAPQFLIATPTATASLNTFAPTTPASGAQTNVEFSYFRSGSEYGPFGFRLDGSVIQTQITTSGGARWQDLTDSAVMEVTNFSISINREPSQELPCPKLCSSGDTTCWPLMYVREFVIDISARMRNNPDIRRSMRSRVRARNDQVEFRIGAGASAMACPS